MHFMGARRCAFFVLRIIFDQRKFFVDHIGSISFLFMFRFLTKFFCTLFFQIALKFFDAHLNFKVHTFPAKIAHFFGILPKFGVHDMHFFGIFKIWPVWKVCYMRGESWYFKIRCADFTDKMSVFCKLRTAAVIIYYNCSSSQFTKKRAF